MGTAGSGGQQYPGNHGRSGGGAGGGGGVSAPLRPTGAPFIAATTFGGAMPGYVFKNGAQGLGYYLDGAPEPAALRTSLSSNSITLESFSRGGGGGTSSSSGGGGGGGGDDGGMNFFAAPSFDGLVPGYVFRSGDKGTGYYRDTAGSTSLPSTTCAACGETFPSRTKMFQHVATAHPTLGGGGGGGTSAPAPAPAPAPASPPPPPVAEYVPAHLSSIPIDDSAVFQPAHTFQGPRPGKVFKNGEYGLGYYLDSAVLPFGAPCPQCGAHVKSGCMRQHNVAAHASGVTLSDLAAAATPAPAPAPASAPPTASPRSSGSTPSAALEAVKAAGTTDELLAAMLLMQDMAHNGVIPVALKPDIIRACQSKQREHPERWTVEVAAIFKDILMSVK